MTSISFFDRHWILYWSLQIGLLLLAIVILYLILWTWVKRNEKSFADFDRYEYLKRTPLKDSATKQKTNNQTKETNK